MKNYFFKKNGKIYIISGKFKGRKISFDNNQKLRPTTNRIREMLFSWLSKYVQKSRCLDCFSGSGALGFEAISRDAEFLTMLEIEKKTISTIKKNARKLNISNLELIHTNTLKWLKKTGNPYDIIFVDPPYYQDLINKTLFLLENKKWLKKDSLIYIEKEKQQTLVIPEHWILYKKKITSRIECYLYIFRT